MTTARSRKWARVESERERGILLVHRRGCVDYIAVDDGVQDFGVEELLGGGGGDVPVEEDEVGEIAGLEAALLVIAELGEGGGLGVGVDGLIEGDLLLELEGHGTGFVLTGDGGVEAAEGGDGLDRVVGTEG